MKRDRAHLVYRNSHDEQTGLPNQALFLNSASAVHLRMVRALFAVLLVEFDYYQLIHERFGYEAGKRLVDAAVGRVESQPARR